MAMEYLKLTDTFEVWKDKINAIIDKENDINIGEGELEIPTNKIVDRKIKESFDNINNALTSKIEETESSLTSKIEETESSLTSKIEETESSLTSKIEETESNLINEINNVSEENIALILALS